MTWINMLVNQFVECFHVPQIMRADYHKDCSILPKLKDNSKARYLRQRHSLKVCSEFCQVE